MCLGLEVLKPSLVKTMCPIAGPSESSFVLLWELWHLGLELLSLGFEAGGLAFEAVGLGFEGWVPKRQASRPTLWPLSGYISS